MHTGSEEGSHGLSYIGSWSLVKSFQLIGLVPLGRKRTNRAGKLLSESEGHLDDVDVSGGMDVEV